MAWVADRPAPWRCAQDLRRAVERTGAVSVRPYPEKHSQPNAFSTCCTSVGDDAAPPIEIHCRLLKSYFVRSGEFTRAVAMIGTRLRESRRSLSISRKTSAQVKRGSMTCLPPINVTECAMPQPLA